MPSVATVTTLPTTATIVAAMDRAIQRAGDALVRFDDPLPTALDGGGWDVRHVLSHIVGSWQRLPLQAAWFLHADPTAAVPVQTGDAYWIAEWATAPAGAFLAAAEAAYVGARAFVQSLDPADLTLRRRTPFGLVSLGDFLLFSVAGHLDAGHGGQLESFVPKPGIR
jgi:hypothetical protein